MRKLVNCFTAVDQQQKNSDLQAEPLSSRN